ncbi:unnamed protein product [Diatraea saccharalis]|uniref:Exoribonuclease phosphorolytic domain-containing protein n=1 Tax=Diatraea saccharalis TaxID=40085 RepID=A0A9P0C1Y6_9NEOP|nr:unnamed protein product [Diatraea saccharalis]
MPLDYRRFNGPEDSVSYKRYTNKYYKGYDELYKELVDDKGRRKDGRALDEARSMFARTDLISQAKGSAYIELKKTKVVCSVFDPREIPHQNEFSQLGQLYCEVKFAPFSCAQQRRPHVDAEDKSLSVALRQALEPTVCRHLFPNYQVDVFVYILEHDGACLAAAINAAGLALANASVPMYDIITSSSVAIIGKKVFVDPTEAEEHLAMMSPETEGTNHGIITMSMLSELKQVSDFVQIGSMDIECVTEAMDILEKECENIVPNIQKVLVHNVVQSFNQRKQLEAEAKEREIALNVKMEEWKKLLNAG